MTLKIDTSVHKLFRKLLKIFTFAVFGYTVALIFKEFFYIHDIFPKALHSLFYLRSKHVQN